MAEIVSGLLDQMEEQGRIDAVEMLARRISTDAADQLSERLSGEDPSSRRTSHLWCVVIAAVCQVYDEAFQDLRGSADRLTEKVMTWLRAQTSSERGASVTAMEVYHGRRKVRRAFSLDTYFWLEIVVKHAIGAVIDAAKQIGDVAAIAQVRLIGAITCPDADRHPAVIKHCIWPLLRGPLTESLERRITEDMRMWLRCTYPSLAS